MNLRALKGLNSNAQFQIVSAAGRTFGNAGAMFAQRYFDFIHDPKGQIAAFGLMGAIVGAAVGLGVVAIVLVLMPTVAGNVITAMYPTNNFSANLFNSTISSVPGQTGGAFNLLGVAALVVVVMIIVGTLMGAFIGSRVG